MKNIIMCKKKSYMSLFIIVIIFILYSVNIVRSEDDFLSQHPELTDTTVEEFPHTISPTAENIEEHPSKPPSHTPPRKRKRLGRKRKRRPHKQTTKQPLLSHTDNDVFVTNNQLILDSQNSNGTEFQYTTQPTNEDFIDILTPYKKGIIQPNEQQFKEISQPLQLSASRESIRFGNIDGIDQDKSHRRSYSEARRNEKLNSNLPASDLKNILKQAGGLSLSEILQQKNLSLGDLLKGKQVALAAIAQPSQATAYEEHTTAIIPKVIFPTKNENLIRRLPAAQSHRTTVAEDNLTTIPTTRNRLPVIQISLTTAITNKSTDDLSNEETNRIPPTIPNIRERFSTHNRVRPIKEVIPAIRPDLTNSNTKRLPNLFSNRSINKEPPRWRDSHTLHEKTKNVVLTTMETIELTTNEISNETITESNKILIEETTATPISSTFSTYKDFRNRLSLRPRLRIGNTFKLSTTTPTTTTTFSEIPSTSDSSEISIAEKIKNSEPIINSIETVSSFDDRNTKFKNVDSLESLFIRFRPNPKYENTQRSFMEYPDEVDVTEINPSLFADITSVKTIDDRTDLLELMGDRRSGARLAKVLEQRNMSLDQLIEHRKRGSSQLHLSEIFFNKTGTSNNYNHHQTDDNNNQPEKLDIVTAFETFPSFNLGNVKSVKPDEIKTDSQGSSYFTSIINIKPTDEIYKEGRAIKVNSQKSNPPSPHAQINLEKIANYPVPDKTSTFDDHVLSEIEDIENSLSRTNDILDLELSGHNFMRNEISIEESIPMGIRSAIIASSCIIVISIFIFILIFVICRWRQKRTNKLKYEESFPQRGKLPILDRNASRRSTSPAVYQETTRCNSKLNTMDPNSQEVQDYLYDAMRRPFQ